ncbi:Putative mitochondrial import receptor subunit Tom6 [Septoria linicola]|uniref:Mitochondrial import receptor subunit Tom6 n=1 Tax=Septoria linicola TaxID=215465 RepID=A0A9Q9ENG0_9PEZI|nr:putative mitochondrial import receptor subunit Tom6 [Septoria linicola]USW55443.1 Putative mitochondrial import receptor subunit Tom6 [Septoria linicola]
MPPKGAARGTAIGGPRQPQRGGFARETYNWVTSSDNRSVVTSLAFFAGGVAFLSSSWSEILLPP